MEHLIECLKSFNSKERFFLLGHVFDNPAFLISSKFRRELEGKLDIIISEDAFAAMDYHLDWLYASLIWAEDYEKKGEPYLKNDIIEGNQEDIDFIIAFDDESISHLIFVEAKGVTGWNQKQMKSKQKRLKNIFGSDGREYENKIKLHFILISPFENVPSEISDHNFPKWTWLRLPVSEKLKKVTRYNQELKKNDIKGSHWKIIDRKY